MSISVSLPSDGETANVADYNTPITTIVNAINGNLDNSNIIAGAAIDASKIASSSITNTQMATSVSPVTRWDEGAFDYVASGCVWSGDSYGSTLAASMTSGVVYIDGKRLTVAAVTARAFTASKDTYVDLRDNGDGTASIQYNEVVNNAASQALTSGDMRIAIIVTGAGNIANAGSINQGQEGKLLPIASSIPYMVTDSLGNLICPRDPNRKILGYKQVVTDQGSLTTPADITGLSCPVIVPTGRKIIIKGYARMSNGTSDAYNLLYLFEGATQLNVASANSRSGSASETLAPDYQTSPTAGLHTYKVQGEGNGGTATLRASATNPAFIRVELV